MCVCLCLFGINAVVRKKESFLSISTRAVLDLTSSFNKMIFISPVKICVCFYTKTDKNSRESAFSLCQFGCNEELDKHPLRVQGHTGGALGFP